MRQALLEYYNDKLKDLEKSNKFSTAEKAIITKYIESEIGQIKREQEACSMSETIIKEG